MKMERTQHPRRFFHLVQREAADHYLFLTVISFAASVSVTRMFLSLAGYPQISGGELHIAHVLWGGLLLYIAALLPLLFANRSIYTVSAMFGGVGIGLFIDEVGKFITKSNDYFYPVAASIIYLFFLLTIVLFLYIRRAARSRSRDQFMRLFEDVWEMLNSPLSSRQYINLRQRLEAAVDSAPTSRHAELARAVVSFLDAEGILVLQEKDPRFPGLVRRTLARLVQAAYLRVYLIVGLVGIGLLDLKNPVSVLLSSRLPPVINSLLGLHSGREIPPETSPLLASIRVELEVIVAVLLLSSAVLIMLKRNFSGTILAHYTLLFSLITVDVLLFYFEQTSTIITTSIQFLLILIIAAYRARLAIPPEASPLPGRGAPMHGSDPGQVG
jgi:hypothetical protein